MRSALRIAIGAVALAGALMAVAAPASAASATTSTDATVASMGDVTGQPWSAPAYPVNCSQEENLISCTPTDPNQVKETACYLGVIVGGRSTTICTTFAGHQDAIKAAGGSPAMVDFGCSFGDIVCGTFQNWGRGAAMLGTALMFSVLKATSFQVGGSLWNAAANEWSFWAWVTLIVLFCAMVWAITAAVISGERDQLVGALIRSFLAIPAVPLTFWLTGQLVEAVDGMTQAIVGRNAGTGGLFTTLQSVMWAGGQAGYVFGFILFGIICIGMLLLLAVFLFRNIALAALIMVGPIAWMIFPARAVGPQWVVRYVSSIVVLLLTGPLTIAFFSLIVHGLATIHTIWDPASWPYLVGLVVIAFAPFAVFGLFTFIGATAVDSIGSRLGSHAAALGSHATRTAVAIPTRMGSTPAGAPSARRMPASKPPSGPHGPAGPGGGTTTATKPSPQATSASKPPSQTPPTTRRDAAPSTSREAPLPSRVMTTSKGGPR